MIEQHVPVWEKQGAWPTIQHSLFFIYYTDLHSGL